MALTTLLTLATLLVDGAALFSPRANRPLRANEIVRRLDPTRRRAFIEIAVAAALEDGRLSADEKEWLDARQAEADPPAGIDAAVADTTSALGSPVDPAKLGGFLMARAATLGDLETRESAFELAGYLLRQAGHDDYAHQTRVFGSGLGIAGATIDDVIGGS